MREAIRIGPLRVSIRLSAGAAPRAVELLVAEQVQSVAVTDGWASFEMESVGSHEVAVLA